MNYFLEKKFIKFKKELDFNKLSSLMSDNNFQSKVISIYKPDYLLDSIFQIRNIQDEEFFTQVYNQMNHMFNKENKRTTLDLFFSYMRGARGDAHRDQESVHIMGAYGRTLYFIDNEEIILERGDRLFIKKSIKHRAIGLTPRIILSFGSYDDY